MKAKKQKAAVAPEILSLVTAAEAERVMIRTALVGLADVIDKLAERVDKLAAQMKTTKTV